MEGRGGGQAFLLNEHIALALPQENSLVLRICVWPSGNLNVLTNLLTSTLSVLSCIHSSLFSWVVIRYIA